MDFQFSAKTQDFSTLNTQELKTLKKKLNSGLLTNELTSVGGFSL